MTKQTQIVVRDNRYWVCDEDLPSAKKRFKRLSGKFPSKHASIIAFSGSPEDLEKITIDDMGTINYPKHLEQIVLQSGLV